MGFHVGVDVGGTFTDLFAIEDEGGTIVVEKADTSEDAIGGVLAALKTSGISPETIESFVFGSTLATNAVVEGKTEPVAFLGTAGFTDTLEIRRLWREHLFGWRWDRPPALVPHNRRYGIRGRIDWRGREIEALDLSSLDGTVAAIRQGGIRTIAVSLLFSFLNSGHELAVRARIKQIAPDIDVILSHEIDPEIGEYERASTTIIAASVSPLVHRLTGHLEAELTDLGIPVVPQMIKSNGGIMSVASARAKPLEVLRSGPAGGVASLHGLSQERGLPNLIGIDIGGTTADVSVITDGNVTYTQQSNLAWDIPMRASFADVRSVGAGGGSIARVDLANHFHVGPESAGSSPGPVCYGRGGDKPTVTDAALVAGLIDPARFLGGRMHVDSHAAREVIEKKVARPLSIPVERAASGTIHLATVRMAQLINEMTVQVGLDPRDYVLVGFGGAGPLFVASLMQETQARHAIVPRFPAVWSAFGGLFADVVHDYARSHVTDLEGLDLEAINGISEELIALAKVDLARDGAALEAAEFRFSFDVRYSGQSHELVIPVKRGPPFDRESLLRVERDFEDQHERTFAHRRPEEPRQLIALRLTVRLPRHLARPTSGLAATPDGSTEARRRSVWFHESPGPIETRIVDRDELASGTVLEGPVIVEEDQNNTVVPPDLTLTVNDTGDLVIERSAS